MSVARKYVKVTNYATGEEKYVHAHQGTVYIAKKCATGKLDGYGITIVCAFIAAEPDKGKLRGDAFEEALMEWCSEWEVDVNKDYTEEEVKGESDPLL